MRYEEWESTVPLCFTQDALWRVQAYRLALFLSDICWQDVGKLQKERRARSLADQLYRAVGSIAANIAEGYSRSSGRDRTRFYEYALGSAREARTWYFAARHTLGEEVTTHRTDLLTRITRLLLTMIPDQRTKSLRELPDDYDTSLQDEAIT